MAVCLRLPLRRQIQRRQPSSIQGLSENRFFRRGYRACDNMIKPASAQATKRACRLLYSKKSLSARVTDKHITSGKRCCGNRRPSQRCFFDMQLFKRCGADRYEQAVLCLVSPSLTKKCPSFFLLNQSTNRKIAHIADRLFEKLGTPHLAEKTEEKKGKSA